MYVEENFRTSPTQLTYVCTVGRARWQRLTGDIGKPKPLPFRDDCRLIFKAKSTSGSLTYKYMILNTGIIQGQNLYQGFRVQVKCVAWPMAISVKREPAATAGYNPSNKSPPPHSDNARKNTFFLMGVVPFLQSCLLESSTVHLLYFQAGTFVYVVDENQWFIFKWCHSD